MMFTLEEMDAKDPKRQTILDVIHRLGQGLAKAQDPTTGLWRNEVSVPFARVESSCTAGIVYAYGRCILEGWLPREQYEPMVLRAWEGLRRMYWSKGLAAQCRGTAIGPTSFYVSRPQGWGAVPQLLMAATVATRLKQQ
jgi:rhamnogalacturonyl hydrolase YesR